MKEMEELRENYWRTIAGTRKSGRIAQSVKDRVEKEWEKFDDDVVRESLSIHISRYRDFKESYTIGIMRNLQKRKESGNGTGRGSNAFNDFEQRKYDYAELEKKLLAQ